jgi:glutamine cyclotransferase
VACRPIVASLALILTLGCGGADAGTGAPSKEVPRKKVRVVDSFPHDPRAYTQGLLSFGDQLFESTGLRGRSSLREVDLATGRVLRQVELPDALFGEGLALVGPNLVQLTWTSGVARVYDRKTFRLLEEYRYSTQGWGLCFDGKRLVMSDGSSTLFFRDPRTFELQGQVNVRAAGEPRERLNELECVGNRVYANVYGTDWILEIDPGSGAVTTAIDASGLLGADEKRGADVLNGIAYRMGSGTFLLTGKLWPRLFEVEFVEPPASAPIATPGP